MQRVARAFIMGSAVIAVLATEPVCAQDNAGATSVAAPEPIEFTFKRLKPPAAGVTKRITVQIDPEEQARLLAAGIAAANPPPRDRTTDPVVVADGAQANPAGPLDWYWETVSPTLGETQGRFTKAVAMLSQGPDGKTVPAPRLQSMQEIAQAHGTDILTATIGTQVSPALVLAVIGIESAGRADAVSSAGAQGLMQLIPDTASRFGVTDSTDPKQNIKGGVAYLDWLMKEFDGDPLMVLAGYNAGEGAVRNNGGVPPYAETRAYVPKVLAAWSVARGLCVTPPELVSDGCVFKVMAPAG